MHAAGVASLAALMGLHPLATLGVLASCVAPAGPFSAASAYPGRGRKAETHSRPTAGGALQTGSYWSN